MELMTKQAFQTKAEAEGKLLRAKLSSVQLVTYYVGLQDWLAARGEIRRLGVPAPNQAFGWARAQIPFATFFAWPWPGESETNWGPRSSWPAPTAPIDPPWRPRDSSGSRCAWGVRA